MSKLETLVAQYKKQLREAEHQLFSNTWFGWVNQSNFNHPKAEVISHKKDYTHIVLSPDISQVELFELMTEATNGNEFGLIFYDMSVNNNTFSFNADLTTSDNTVVKFSGDHKKLKTNEFISISNVEVLIEDI